MFANCDDPLLILIPFRTQPQELLSSNLRLNHPTPVTIIMTVDMLTGQPDLDGSSQTLFSQLDPTEC